MIELKPCPFCGGDGKLFVLYDGYHVECNSGWKCPVIPRTWGYETESEAEEAWNRRASE